MSVNYSAAIKTARMTATRDAVANGTLEILSPGGGVLAVFGLSASGGTVTGSAWTLDFDATTVTGLLDGDVGAARIKTAAGTVAIDGLLIGQDITVNVAQVTAGLPVQIGATVFTHF